MVEENKLVKQVDFKIKCSNLFISQRCHLIFWFRRCSRKDYIHYLNEIESLSRLEVEVCTNTPKELLSYQKLFLSLGFPNLLRARQSTLQIVL